jgi:hypothetical protein
VCLFRVLLLLLVCTQVGPFTLSISAETECVVVGETELYLWHAGVTGPGARAAEAFAWKVVEWPQQDEGVALQLLLHLVSARAPVRYKLGPEPTVGSTVAGGIRKGSQYTASKVGTAAAVTSGLLVTGGEHARTKIPVSQSPLAVSGTTKVRSWCCRLNVSSLCACFLACLDTNTDAIPILICCKCQSPRSHNLSHLNTPPRPPTHPPTRLHTHKAAVAKADEAALQLRGITGGIVTTVKEGAEYAAKKVGPVLADKAVHVSKRVSRSGNGTDDAPVRVGVSSRGGNAASTTKDQVVEVAMAGAHAAVEIFNAFDAAAAEISKHMGTQTAETVRHRYGDEAGEVASVASRAFQNGVAAAREVRSVGVRSTAKRVGKETAKKVVSDYDAKREAVVKRTSDPDSDTSSSAAAPAPAPAPAATLSASGGGTLPTPPPPDASENIDLD